jgi:glycosyltransferase involved in cell wall biosynthesis
MNLISVCIPTYEMRGLGTTFLKESLDILEGQTFKDFDVVICDNSKDSVIKNFCESYSSTFKIHYFSNPTGTGLSSNLNYIIKNNCAKGKFLKILAQDDYLHYENALEKTAKGLIENTKWLVTGCIHTIDGKNFFKPVFPKYNRSIHLGNNTIGGLSVLTIKNDNPLFFDESLMWLPDCEYYKRCYDKYGSPQILNETLTVVRLGGHNITNTEATLKVRTKDFNKVLKQYEKGTSYWFYKTIYLLKYPLRKLRLKMFN